MFLSIRFFAIFFLFGNLDYATVFRISSNRNESRITIIGLLFLLAGMGKSAQMGMHTWLPDRMEGNKSKSHIGNCQYCNNKQLANDNGFGYNANFHNQSYYSAKVINSNVKSKTSHNFLANSISTLPKNRLYTITGNMLGDGSIGYFHRKSLTNSKSNPRYKMGMTIRHKEYMEYLRRCYLL